MAQPGGPCAGSSPAAAWPCPVTRNSAAPPHAAAATSTPSRPRLAAAVAAFNDSQLEERDRARRAGGHPVSDITVETRLRILRDLAVHLTSAGPVSGWSQVTTTDLEAFLGHSPNSNRHQRTYVLRGFFRWAKRRKLILIDPAISLRLGSQPAFHRQRP